MLNQEIIEKTEVFLKRKFDAADYLNAHPEAKAYRIEHTYRVANIGRELALKEGFDAAHIARPFLSELGLAEDRINDICYGIAIHVDEKADFPGERTPFALSVGAADNIVAYSRIGDLLHHQDNF